MKQKSEPIHARLCVALILAVTTPGSARCAETTGGRDGTPWPAMRALGRDLPVNRGEPSKHEDTPAMHTQSQHEPEGVLTLLRALELALLHSPELVASSHTVWAAEGNAKQQGARPNPEIGLDASEFAGSGARQGFDAAETSVSLSQSFELGGKRAKRQRVARLEARLAGWDYEAKRMDILAETQKAFVDVLHAQGQLALVDSLLSVVEEMRKAAAERVKSGKVSLLEETKAGVEVASVRIARERARQELATARKRLAASWGGTAPVFTEAAGDLEITMDVAPLDKFSPLLGEIPEVARWNEEVALARESLALAKAERVPDLGVSAGISRFEEDGTTAGMLGVSVPLPLFDRNAGGILSAEHQATRAELEQHAAELRAMNDLVEAHSRLEMARMEALAIKTELLPGAQQAFDAAQAGYREGKFGQLEMLDTRRTLSEARSRYLEVLAAYHKAVADVERLTGTPINTIQ
ncbi:MAG: TolC family protein [Verrucomicrobiales bacterium]